MSLAVNRQYITPITSAGVPVDPGSESTFETSRGVFELDPGTYYFILPVGGSTMFDLHLTHDASLEAVATIQTCGHAPSDVSDFSAVQGEWLDHAPPGSYVPTAGTSTASSGVVTIAGGGGAGDEGGADWQVSDCPAPRARLELIVAALGTCRVSFTAKQ